MISGPYKFKWILAPFIYCFLDCFYMFAIAMLWPETRDAVYKFATFGEFGSESMYDVLQVGQSLWRMWLKCAFQLQFILTFVVQTSLFCILWSIQRTVWFLKDKFTPETSTTDSDTKLLKEWFFLSSKWIKNCINWIEANKKRIFSFIKPQIF